jgi:diguanylate cyclase (GGDEF)-like protein
MKKLIFDDFQLQAGRKYVVEEVQETSPRITAQSQSLPSSSTKMEEPALKNFANIKPETKQPSREFQVADFFDVDSPMFKGDAEPRAEFDFLLNKVLALIKEVVFANSVAFFWANREKQQLVIESRVTDSPVFMSRRRLPIGHDLISKVAINGKPELITDVNPLSEAELLPYYDSPAEIKSFVGVPVFFSNDPSTVKLNQPVAVIVADSVVEGSFGTETLILLGQFTKLISGLIKSYTQKYDLLLDSEVLSSLDRMKDKLKAEFTYESITNILADETSKLVSLDFLSIVLYDEKKHVWVAKNILNRMHDPYIGPEQVIDFPASIAGQTIKYNTKTLAESTEGSALPRYHKGELVRSHGSFLSLPISSLNKCYGSLNIERKEKSGFSNQDVEVLSHLVMNVANALEVMYMNDIIREYVIIDDITGVYSKKFFFQRLEEELKRADDTNIDLSLLIISVDHAHELNQRFGQDGFDRVMNSLAKAVRTSVRSYDLVGRIDSNRFGTLLVNTVANDACLWSEKIRKNVAGQIIELDGKSFSITISVGVCGAVEGMKIDELIDNAVTVLHKASSAGGNAVRVF